MAGKNKKAWHRRYRYVDLGITNAALGLSQAVCFSACACECFSLKLEDWCNQPIGIALTIGGGGGSSGRDGSMEKSSCSWCDDLFRCANFRTWLGTAPSSPA